MVGRGRLGCATPADKQAFVRVCLDHLRAGTSDPDLFAAVERLAETDGAFLAATMVPQIARIAGSPDGEDEASRHMAEFIDHRKALIRRDGVPESEAVAYAMMIALTAIVRFEEVRANLREAERAGRH